MKKEDFFKELVADITRKEIAVFVGAGLSLIYPTCFPTWGNYRNLILESLIDSIGTEVPLEMGIDNLYSFLLRIPFKPEVMLEQLAREDMNSLPNVLDILENGTPNVLHKIMARCAKTGFIRVFMTTNFDTMLEEAFDAEGVDYETLISENDFSEFSREGLAYFKKREPTQRNSSLKLPPIAKLADSASKRVRQVDQDFRDCSRSSGKHRFENKAVVIKLHGSIADKRSIQMTLSQTSTYLKEVKIYSLRFIMSQYNVLFLGYSGNDNDIAPEIAKFRIEYPKEKKELELIVPFTDDDVDIVENLYDIKEQHARKVFWLVYKKDSEEAKKSINTIISTYKNDGVVFESDLEEFAISVCTEIAELDLRTDHKDFMAPAAHLEEARSIDKQQLSKWAKSISICDRLLMISNLLNICHDFHNAEVLAQLALNYSAEGCPWTIFSFKQISKSIFITRRCQRSQLLQGKC